MNNDSFNPEQCSDELYEYMGIPGEFFQIKAYEIPKTEEINASF